ncbi:MAG: response regulator [Lachnospiraceae bacterium]|nr:response regulator [Lachnospiraceae bacterium]
MILKVMVTGKNRRIASDICDHLEHDRGYITVKCPPKKTALFDSIPREMPHIVIICLGDETADSVKVFDILKEYTKLKSTTILVVANDEDRGQFINHTELDRMFFLSRPVSLFALYEKLNDIEKNIEKYREENNDLITEYVNTGEKTSFQRKHILVVDDDPELLIQIKDQLQEFYEVTLVGSGKNMFKYLEKFNVDLILLDYLMPEMDGPEVLLKLREYPEYKDIPVIFLTGVSEKETVIKTLVDLMPQGYVLKPSKRSELVAKIIDVLDNTDEEEEPTQ